jgi:hypothetical protein
MLEQGKMSLVGPWVEFHGPQSYAMVLLGRLDDLDHLNVPDKYQKCRSGSFAMSKGQPDRIWLLKRGGFIDAARGLSAGRETWRTAHIAHVLTGKCWRCNLSGRKGWRAGFTCFNLPTGAPLNSS